MVETSHTAEQAELLASALFGEFLWQKVGPTNHDWPCEDSEHHGVATHPCDVVYFYDEPYAQVRTYVHCDLKSYAKGSITKAAVSGAIQSLAKQVACAEKSDDWRRLHVHDRVTPAICGLLFVYNHDGEYDKDFQDHLNQITPQSLQLPKGAKLVVLGPKEIFWLDNIRHEIQQMRGKATPDLPSANLCKYYYPQLVRRANVQIVQARAATLEMLTSPIIILEHNNANGHGRGGIVVFYSRPGEHTDEFLYLIDIIRKFQLLSEGVTVRIKTLGASPISSPTFQKAQQQYIEGLAGSESDLARYVQNIRYEPMTQVKTTYSNIDLGTWS